MKIHMKWDLTHFGNTVGPYIRTGAKQAGRPILAQGTAGDNFLVLFRTGDNFWCFLGRAIIFGVF